MGEGFGLEFPSDLKLFSQFSSKYIPVSNQEKSMQQRKRNETRLIALPKIRWVSNNGSPVSTRLTLL